MLQLLALHYFSYFRTEHTNPPILSLNADPFLFTNTSERGCAGDNKKSYILSRDSAMQEEGWSEDLLLTQWCVHPSV